MSTVPLRFTNVVKYYENFCAVDGVSFEVQPGEIFGLLGPNGAGKTTCISMINTLEPPSAGKVEVFGLDVTTHPMECKSSFGLVPQEMIGHAFFSTREVLEFYSGYHGITSNGEWIQYLMEKLHLWEHRDRIVRQLSGGMKRRLLIAKALVHRPPLLLLDEPTAGVDIELREGLWNFVEQLRKDGTSVLLTTHYLEEAQQLCDRVGIIHHGKIQTLGSTSELIERLTARELHLRFHEEVEIVPNEFLLHKSERGATFRIPNRLDFSSFISTLGISPGAIQDIHMREGTLEDAVRHTLRNGSNRKESPHA